MANNKKSNRRNYVNKKQNAKGRNLDGGDRMSPKSNPIGWHNKFAFLFDQVTKVPFNVRTGQRVVLGDAHNGFVQDYNGCSITRPGLMVFPTIPTYGVANATSGLNVMTRDIFNRIRAHRTGYTAYGPTAVGWYLMAADSLYCLYATALRAYGLYRYWRIENMYYPKAMITALDFNMTDMIEHNAEWCRTLEYMRMMLNNLAIPSDVALIDRHMFMFSGIYTDENSINSGAYAFVPEVLWKYVPTENKMVQVPLGRREGLMVYANDTAKTQITDIKFDAGRRQMTYTQLRFLFDELITPLLTDDDMQKITSDTLQVTNNIRINPPISEDFLVTPAYDETMLTQIENMTIAGHLLPGVEYVEANSGDPTKAEYIMLKPAKFKVTTGEGAQETPFVTYGYGEGVGYLCNKRLFNLHHDEPTKDEIFEGSRLMVGGVHGSTFTSSPGKPLDNDMNSIVYMANITAMPAEIVTSATIYTGITSDQNRFSESYPYPEKNPTTNGVPFQDAMFAFRAHPNIPRWTGYSRATDPSKWSIHPTTIETAEWKLVQDLDIYTPIEDNVLAAMNDVDMYSLLNTNI